MTVVVLGTRKVEFEDQKTGKQISGTSIYVYYPAEGVDGYMGDKIFIRSDSTVVLPEFEYGEKYDFHYEGFGRRMTLVSIQKSNK